MRYQTDSQERDSLGTNIPASTSRTSEHQQHTKHEGLDEHHGSHSHASQGANDWWHIVLTRARNGLGMVVQLTTNIFKAQAILAVPGGQITRALEEESIFLHLMLCDLD
jgi:hypothetical protein